MGLLGWVFKRKKRRTSPLLTWERTPPHSPHVYVDAEGRRHRGDAPYLLPKDEQELQRLDYQHYILRQLLKGNTFAPVHDLLIKGGHVLDVGCGTGRWGYEIATSYPKTQVVGFDLEDGPRTASTPLNYHFSGGNLLGGLPFPAHTFHYVHQRLLVAGIPLDKWPWVVGELRRVTQPGGWIELVEMGNTFHHAGPATQQFLTWWVAITASKGIDASKMAQIGVFLKQAGLFNIKAETKLLSVGSWGGRLGNLLAQDMLAGWPSMRPLASSLLGVPPETFHAVIGRLEAEWETYQTTYEVYLACGQA
jgi:ubiquinone/menaquinone biosynthesis C-methylase UbiE